MKWNEKVKIFLKEFEKIFILGAVSMYGVVMAFVLIQWLGSILIEVMPVWACTLTILLILIIIISIVALVKTSIKIKTKN